MKINVCNHLIVVLLQPLTTLDQLVSLCHPIWHGVVMLGQHSVVVFIHFDLVVIVVIDLVLVIVLA